MNQPASVFELAGTSFSPDQSIGPIELIVRSGRLGGGELRLRYPETVQSDSGRTTLFIDHHTAALRPVMRPKAPPRWTTAPDGAIHYECVLDGGIRFAGRATPRGERLLLAFSVTNDSPEDVRAIFTQFCLMTGRAPDFADGDMQRTYMLVNGAWLKLSQTTPWPADITGRPWVMADVKGGPFNSRKGYFGRKPWTPNEVADVGLIATQSPDAQRVLALAWRRPYKVMANGANPCIHADPHMGDCAAGRTVTAEGVLYLIQGSLEDLLRRYREDFGG